jgi:hypothetical protein
MRYVVEHTVIMTLAARDDLIPIARDNLMPMARVWEVNGIIDGIAPGSTSPLVATRG